MSTPPAPGAHDLPDSLGVVHDGGVSTLTLRRPRKRNALSDELVLGLERFFTTLGPETRCVVLDAEGDHFCAGLDLAELTERDAMAGVHHSRMWHRALAAMEAAVPVVSVLKGAVVGGGLELAAATHVRIAEPSTFFALPEGQRGLFVGGGGSVRVPRLIGTARMADMMLTGRRVDAGDGHRIGLAQYLVGAGEGRDLALELAGRIAQNAPQTNFAVLQALPRIADAAPEAGYLMESLMAAVAQSTDDAKSRMTDFLERRTPR